MISTMEKIKQGMGDGVSRVELFFFVVVVVVIVVFLGFLFEIP